MDCVSPSPVNKCELNGPQGTLYGRSGLLSYFVPSFFILLPCHRGLRPRLEPSVQLTWLSVELMVALQIPISKIRSDFKNESHFYFSPIRHLPISLEVKVPPITAQRHYPWHERRMFQASGGILCGLVFVRGKRE